ncbi:MAG: hypothetical protein ACXVPQ_02345 [Bacteroidia bacterium]
MRNSIFFFLLYFSFSCFSQDKLVIKYENRPFAKKVSIISVSADSVIFKTGDDIHNWPSDLIMAYKKNYKQPGPYIFIKPADTLEYEVTDKEVNFIGTRIKGQRNGYQLTTSNLLRPYIARGIPDQTLVHNNCIEFMDKTDSVVRNYKELRRIYIKLKEDDEHRMISSKEFTFTDTAVILRFEKHHKASFGVFPYKSIESFGVQTYKMKKIQYFVMVPAIPFAIVALAVVPGNAGLIVSMYENYYRRFDVVKKYHFKITSCEEIKK